MSRQVAKLFLNGRSQAVRLPKEFRFDSDEVYIRRQGKDVILTLKKPTWDDFFDAPTAFDDEFLKDRENVAPQERDIE